MLILMDWAIRNEFANNETDFLEKIKFPRQNIANVRACRQSFTKEHIFNACELTGASADYIFGFTPKITRRSSKNSLELLKEATMAIESEYKKNRR